METIALDLCPSARAIVNAPVLGKRLAVSSNRPNDAQIEHTEVSSLHVINNKDENTKTSPYYTRKGMVLRDVQLQITSKQIEATERVIERLSSFDSGSSDLNLRPPSRQENEDRKSPRPAETVNYATICISNNNNSHIYQEPQRRNSVLPNEPKENNPINNITEDLDRISICPDDTKSNPHKSPRLGAIPKVKIEAPTPSEDFALPHYENIEIFRHCERHNPSSPRLSPLQMSTPNSSPRLSPLRLSAHNSPRLSPSRMSSPCSPGGNVTTFTHLCEVHHRPSIENLNVLELEEANPIVIQKEASPKLVKSPSLETQRHNITRTDLLKHEPTCAKRQQHIQHQELHQLQVEDSSSSSSSKPKQKSPSPQPKRHLTSCEILKHDSTCAMRHFDTKVKPPLKKSASEQVQLESKEEFQQLKYRRSFSHRDRKEHKDDLPRVHKSSSRKNLKSEMECSKV